MHFSDSPFSTRAILRTTIRALPLVLFAMSGGPAPAQVASALVREGAQMPGGEAFGVISAINNSAANHVGGYAFTINTADSLSHVWGSAAGGPGAPLQTEGVIGDVTQTSFETFFGLADDGTAAYSPLCTRDTFTGLDAVFAGDALISIERDPVPNMPGQFWSFGSRPSISAAGVPVWVGGITSTQGGSTQNRGMFSGAAADVLLLGGQTPPDLPFPLVTSTMSFDFRISANGQNWIIDAQMSSGSTTNDTAVVMNGSGLILDSVLVREGNVVPASVGGVGGEAWQGWGFFGINNAGDYFFTGDTSAATASDLFILKNGQFIVREGGTVDGHTIGATMVGAYMNEDADLAYIVQANPGTGLRETLFFNGTKVLAVGDAVDLDNDGVVEPGSVLSDFTGITALTMGDRQGGEVALYFTADVDTLGTPSLTDDTEGGFELVLRVALPADMNCDGLVDNGDIDAFVLALTDPAGYVATYPDCSIENGDTNGDGSTDNGDIDSFVQCLLNGGCV